MLILGVSLRRAQGFEFEYCCGKYVVLWYLVIDNFLLFPPLNSQYNVNKIAINVYGREENV